MRKQQIDNLKELIDMEYPHICLSYEDFQQFIQIPWEAKRFYPMRGKGQWYEKKGFFHNGKTTVWATHGMQRNHIKIADKEIPTLASGAYWSKEFSFEEASSPKVIQKMMQLKAFW